MKFLKDNWFKILIVMAACIGFLYLGKCSSRPDIKAAKKVHEEIIKKIEDEKEAVIKKEKEKNKIEIDALRKQIANDEAFRIEQNKKISELENSIRNIPKRTTPFTELKKCQDEYNNLEADYIRRGELVVELKIDIGKLSGINETYLELELKYNEREAIWVKDKAAWEEKEAEYKRYTKQLEQKQKQPLFAVAIGPGIDTRGHFRFSLTVGINILRIPPLKL